MLAVSVFLAVAGLLNRDVAKFSDSSSDPAHQQELRRQILDLYESKFIFDLKLELDELLDKSSEELLKLQEGKIISDPPDLKINLGPVKKILLAAALEHYLFGKSFGTFQLSENSSVGAEGVPPSDDTVELGDPLVRIARASSLSDSEVTAITELYKQRFFTVVGLYKEDIQKVWKIQLMALKEGWILKDFKTKIQSEIHNLSNQRIELIYRNWMNQSFREGKQSLLQDPDFQTIIAGWTYRAILDSRVRPDHAVLDGISLPIDHELWKYRTPPWEHNCRCDLDYVSFDDIKSGKIKWTETIPDYDKNQGF